MGTTYSNFQVFCGDAAPGSVREQIVEGIREHLVQLGYEEVTTESEETGLDRTVRVGMGTDESWIAVYDENCDGDLDGLDPWCVALSVKLNRPVLAVTVLDSDLACLHLFENGRLLEALDSSRRRRKHAVDWARFLTKPTGVKQFTDAFYQKNAYAEENVSAVAPLLGLNPESALVGYRYLPEANLETMALRFRSRTQSEHQKGKTRFGFLSRLGDWIDAVPGATKDVGVHLTNQGEASTGLQVVVWGPAVSEGAVSVDAVQARSKACAESVTPEGAATADGQPVYVARFPMFPIPDGFDREDPANKRLQFAKVLERQRATGVWVRISATAVKSGGTTLFVACIPYVNPDGSYRYAVPIEIGG